MTRLALALLLLSACALAPSARAQDGQLYFVAKVDAVQSIANTATGPNTVYLYWDLLSGTLPAGLESFEIVRSDQVEPIAVLPVSPMSATVIEEMYDPADQSRRRAQVLRWLLDDHENGIADESELGAEIAQRIGPGGDIPWTIFGARMDFNIARARHRAFRDDTAPGGVVEYELLGRYTGQPDPVRLGHVQIDTSQPHVVGAPDALVQVPTHRCDAPEEGKAQGAFALNWNHPGEEIAELASNLLIAGYDVYCSEEPTEVVAPLDLRALAASQGHDADGNVAFAGLRKLTAQPVIVSGTAEKSERLQGYREDYWQFHAAPDEARAWGMDPGERFACYVVPIDVSGNYGETAGALVEIPDLAAPPAPWSVEVQTDTPNDELILSWDHVDVGSYHRKHRSDRTWCNLDTARLEGELRFAPDGEVCGEADVRMPLDVTHYLLYRFDDWNDAKRFDDSDGDGVGDPWEQVLADDPTTPNPGVPICDTLPAGEPCLTHPGLACDADNASPGPDFLAVELEADAFTVTRPSGRQLVEFRDPIPGAQPGQIFYYRLMARGANGNLSELSAPVRVRFPDRTRPQRDDFLFCKFELEEPECPVTVGATSLPDQVQAPFGNDFTSPRRADWLRIGCFTEGGGIYSKLHALDDQGQVARSRIDCEELYEQCGDGAVLVEYLDPDGVPLGSAGTFGGQCNQLYTAMTENCDGTVGDPIDSGDVPDGSLEIFCGLQDHCLEIFREVNGVERRVKTWCPGEDPICLDGYLVEADGELVEAECPPGRTEVPLPNLDGGPICLSVALANDNNIASSRMHLPCFRSRAEPPGIPDPVEVAFPADQVELTWLPAQGHATATLLELSLLGSDYVLREVVEHMGVSASDGPLALALDVAVPAPVDDERQEWCFRARSIGAAPPGRADKALSAWSGRRCSVRAPGGTELPEYLGWPQIRPRPDTDPLEARYLTNDGVPVLLLSDAPTCLALAGDPVCVPGQNGEPICFGDGLDTTVNLDSSAGCNDICDELERELAGKLHFVPYRQERSGPGQVASEFVQVGPLVEYGHCSDDVVFDPLIKPVNFLEPDDWAGPQLVFVDRYPHRPDRQYRYQFVHMDAQGEIVAQRTSNWISAP